MWAWPATAGSGRCRGWSWNGFFHLDDEDRRLIGARRRDHNRLGFALQVVTVRNLGMFLADPLDVPPELVGYLAEQLGIEDPSCLPEYLERRPTRFEHQAEITSMAGRQWTSHRCRRGGC